MNEKVKVALSDILSIVSELGNEKSFYVKMTVMINELRKRNNVSHLDAKNAIEGAIRFGALRRRAAGVSIR